MGATRPASGKDAAIISRVCILFFHYPDAGRVAPISACVLCLRFVVLVPYTILQKLYLPSILHLTLIRCNALTINILLSVRYYQCHLHATYTTYILPHGTSTGGRHYGIGGQKSLSLRQIFLRPSGV